MILLGIIDFIFQYGETVKESDSLNWSEVISNGVIAILSAIVAGLIAYKVARIQIKHDQEIQKEEREHNLKRENDIELQRINERLFYFKWLIRRIIKLSKSQANDYKDLSLKISQNNLGTFQLATRALSDIDRLLSINFEDIFNSIIRKHGTDEKFQEDLRKIISNIDFINLVLREVYKLFQGMHIEVRDLKIKYRENVQNINKEFLKILFQIEKDDLNYKKNALWLYLDNRLIFYNADMPDDCDVDWMNENYIHPTQQFLVQNFRKVEILQPALGYGKDALLLAGQIKFSAEKMANDLSNYSETIYTSISELETSLINFEKL